MNPLEIVLVVVLVLVVDLYEKRGPREDETHDECRKRIHRGYPPIELPVTEAYPP